MEVPEGGVVLICVLGKVHGHYVVASPANHVLLWQHGIPMSHAVKTFTRPRQELSGNRD